MNKDDLTEELNREISWKSLHKAGRDIPIPFQLTLKDSEEVLYCDKVLRIVPGKRLVAFGIWGKNYVVAKIFYGSKAKQHIKDDASGIKALISSNIPTPKILYQGLAKEKKIHVLLFERILNGINLDELWQEKISHEELAPILKEITLELATQHVLGIVQRDLHLKNFLITNQQIYTLDGGNITQHHDVLPKKESLDHLALFFSQLGAGTEKLQDELFQIYIKARGWIIKKSDVAMLQNAIYKWTKTRWLDYNAKIKRNCTAIGHKRTLTSKITYDRTYFTPSFEKLLSNPESIFQEKDTEILKAGRTSTIAKIKVDNRYFVVKRYNIKNALHWLRRCIRPTRAAKSWNLAHRLIFCGIPTAKPVAYIENQVVGLRGKSYFIMEYVDAPHAGQYFENYTLDNSEFTEIAERIVRLFSNLARLWITHGDLKMTNILIKNQRPIIIDLDGMLEHNTILGLNRSYRKEMERFMKNWQDQPNLSALFEEIIVK